MNEYKVRYQEEGKVKTTTFHADNFQAVMKKIELWVDIESLLSVVKTRRVAI